MRLCMHFALIIVPSATKYHVNWIWGSREIHEKPTKFYCKVMVRSAAVLPWRSITYRDRNLSSASYLNIARWRSALGLQNRVLRARAGWKSWFSGFSWFSYFGVSHNNLVSPRKVIPKVIQSEWDFACTSLQYFSRGKLKIYVKWI